MRFLLASLFAATLVAPALVAPAARAECPDHVGSAPDGGNAQLMGFTSCMLPLLSWGSRPEVPPRSTACGWRSESK